MEAAYQPKLWHELYVMLGGAVAALLGLLFVATSLQVREIANRPHLHARAFNNTFALVVMLMVTAVCLIPQPRIALGIEVFTLNLFFAFAAPLHVIPRFLKLGLPIHRPVIGLLSVLVGACGGLSLVFQVGGGMYLVTASLLLIVAQCIFNAWSLMVEALPNE
jgi:modulator of FtsH protease